MMNYMHLYLCYMTITCCRRSCPSLCTHRTPHCRGKVHIGSCQAEPLLLEFGSARSSGTGPDRRTRWTRPVRRALRLGWELNEKVHSLLMASIDANSRDRVEMVSGYVLNLLDKARVFIILCQGVNKQTSISWWLTVPDCNKQIVPLFHICIYSILSILYLSIFRIFCIVSNCCISRLFSIANVLCMNQTTNQMQFFLYFVQYITDEVAWYALCITRRARET